MWRSTTSTSTTRDLVLAWPAHSISDTRSSTRTALPDQEVVLVNARVAVVGELPDLPQEPSLTSTATRCSREPIAGFTSANGAMCQSMRSMSSPQDRPSLVRQ